MPDFEDDPDPLTSAERIFLRELRRLEVRFMLVGMSAAVLQGADLATQDLDLWFESMAHPGIGQAALLAGGFYVSRTQPPIIGGEGLERIDLVTHCHGLDAFDAEYQCSLDVALGDLALRVLPLERILVSKSAADRPKDRAALEALKAALAVQRELSRRR